MGRGVRLVEGKAGVRGRGSSRRLSPEGPGPVQISVGGRYEGILE